jgi:hypothetical protein
MYLCVLLCPCRSVWPGPKDILDKNMSYVRQQISSKGKLDVLPKVKKIKQNSDINFFKWARFTSFVVLDLEEKKNPVLRNYRENQKVFKLPVFTVQ